MEDKAILLPSLAVVEPSKFKNAAADSFFAVFDGHNGVDVATYASAHFPHCLLESYAENSTEAIMKSAFDALDKRIDVRCRHETCRSGSTAVCALLRNGRQLCIGWCGDSAVAILRAGSVVTLTTSHSPDVPEEASRVEEAGGCMIWIQGELRVNGVLNLTRSLGDIDGKPMISSVPDIICQDLDGGEYLLMLACDGVWDAFSESEVYAHVEEFIENHKSDEYDRLASYIVSKAKNAGATDNLTLIVVFLRSPDELWSALT
ncbi:hypothetical protein AB6A40_007775 [Gnathostoma spinigerum]|uniref:PPM-type phosphatase domain-containing protein n=1 Tax=Gnathostoma spinigerum TaxID=75299 RepID=A0ABD6EMR3_9BILA